MTKFKSAIAKVLGWASVVLFALLVCTTVWQVFSRQILQSPSTWSEEFAKVCFVWLAFLGSAYVFGERGHIAVDFAARALPLKVQKATVVFVQITIIIFAIFALVWGGLRSSFIAWNQNLTALPFTIGWIYLIMPVAGVAIALFACMDLIAVLTGQEPPYPELDESDDIPRDLPLSSALPTEKGR